MMKTFHKLTSPKYFYEFAGKLLPWIAAICACLFIYGLIGGLYLAPPDYQQGDGFRIIYVHVPTAFLSMAIYFFMAVAAAVSFIWKIKLADIIVKVSPALGAWFTVLALFTGSMWGKPMWGTYWVWDARLTSELILLFLYLGAMALQSAIPDRNTASRAVGILVLVGAIDLPIIHYSVSWWNTLHQGDTINVLGKSTIASSMLYPLLAMIFAFSFYYIFVLLIRMRCEILEREYKTDWVRGLV